jgi:SAM-dependent methyltransferase
MLFARPWRAPGDFVAEQHALARRPGQLENSTTMARALFDATGQREVMLDRLAAVTVPTLVIWGDRDYVLPASQAGAAADRLPDARVSVFPDCGHLPHVEHPDRFSTELAGWLAEQRASTDSRPARTLRLPKKAAMPTDEPPATPDPHKTARTYGPEANRYDRRTTVYQRWRDAVVAKLDVGTGDTVLDVGCGTGLCMSALHDKVGPSGTIVGIDASDEMLGLARERATHNDWHNVRLLSASEPAALQDVRADGALFCAVHDVLQSPAVLTQVLEHLRPGAPVAAAGGKRPPIWAWGLRGWIRSLHSPYIDDFTGFDRPWRLLAAHVPDLNVRELAFGTGYLATGHTPAPTP